MPPRRTLKRPTGYSKVHLQTLRGRTVQHVLSNEGARTHAGRSADEMEFTFSHNGTSTESEPPDEDDENEESGAEEDTQGVGAAADRVEYITDGGHIFRGKALPLDHKPTTLQNKVRRLLEDAGEGSGDGEDDAGNDLATGGSDGDDEMNNEEVGPDQNPIGFVERWNRAGKFFLGKMATCVQDRLDMMKSAVLADRVIVGDQREFISDHRKSRRMVGRVEWDSTDKAVLEKYYVEREVTVTEGGVEKKYWVKDLSQRLIRLNNAAKVLGINVIVNNGVKKGVGIRRACLPVPCNVDSKPKNGLEETVGEVGNLDWIPGATTGSFVLKDILELVRWCCLMNLNRTANNPRICHSGYNHHCLYATPSALPTHSRKSHFLEKRYHDNLTPRR